MHLPVHWLLIALAALLLPACGNDDTAADRTATVHASEGASAKEGSWLRIGAPNSEFRKSPEWTALRQQASNDNDAMAVLGALEQAADLSPGSEEQLAAYGENSLYRLYWQVVRAKLTFDGAHRSGNPIKIKAAEKAYTDRIATIRKEWEGRRITVPMTVYNITEQRVILGWGSLPLRFMPAREVMILAFPESVSPEAREVSYEDLVNWPFEALEKDMGMESFQMLMLSGAANFSTMMNPNAPFAQRAAHSASTLFALEYSFIRGYYDGLTKNPLSLAMPGNTTWMAPPAKLIATLENARPSPLLAYCPVPGMVPLERAAQYDVGDVVQGVVRIVGLESLAVPAEPAQQSDQKADAELDEYFNSASRLPVMFIAILESVTDEK